MMGTPDVGRVRLGNVGFAEARRSFEKKENCSFGVFQGTRNGKEWLCQIGCELQKPSLRWLVDMNPDVHDVQQNVPI